MARVDKVVFNPGNFGHLIIRTLEAQYSNSIPQYGESLDSHMDSVDSGANVFIEMQHPFDGNRTYDRTWIKPYFKDHRLKYFPFYCNYVKYQQPNGITIDIEDFIRTYWNHNEQLIPENNIDMGLFLHELDAWISILQEIIGETLSKPIKEFLFQKSKANKKILSDFLQGPVDSNIILAIRICQYINNDDSKFYALEKHLHSTDRLRQYV